ncbi:MAG: response regulator [Gammaproteobacteria bacterium]|nr:response regulator [Gammaproteobacteria bacterium]
MTRSALRFLLALLIYVVGVAGLAYGVYALGKQQYLREVDQRLLTAASRITHLLPANFHDRARDAKAISVEEDTRNMALLSSHANTGGFAYLYFYVVDQGMVYFTASSATAEDYLNNEASTYWTAYPEGPPEFLEAYRANAPVHVTNTDRWGSFRSVLVPLRSPSGQPFVAGADINISDIDAGLLRQALGVAALGLLMLGLAVPMMLAFRRSQLDANKELQELNARLQGDIEHAVHIEGELRHARDEAQSANACKSQFLAHMSHDIRTPLHGVLGLLDLLRQTPLNAQQNGYVDTARDTGLSLANTIDRLLDFTAADGGKISPRLEAVHIRRFCDELARGFMSLIGPRRLELLIYATHSVPEYLVLDPVLLRQILVNLLGNAVKFTERGHIEAVLVWHQDQLSGRISDTGTGIPPNCRQHIFEPFQQADNSLSRENSGTGLGLPLAKMLCLALGGDLWLEHSDPRGSRFAFRVLAARGDGLSELQRVQQGRPLVLLSSFSPLALWLRETVEAWGLNLVSGSQLAEIPEALLSEAHVVLDAALGEPLLGPILERLPDPARVAWLDWADSPQAPPAGIRQVLHKPLSRQALADWLTPAEQRAPMPPPEQKTQLDGQVLVVEDNEVNRLIAVRVLNKAGLQTAVAENGQEALERCREQHFDLILMDIQMAGMDGLEATRRLHQEWGADTPPIVGLSAHAYAEHIAEAQAAGMCDYLSKPFRHEELLNRVRHWLEKSHKTPPERAEAG